MTMPSDYTYKPWPWDAIDAAVEALSIAEFTRRLQVLAHFFKGCPDCEATGKYVCGVQNIATKSEASFADCLNCKDGKVFVLPEMVRVKCGCQDQSLNSYIRKHCSFCSGLGTAASDRMEDWIKAVMEKEWEVHFELHRTGIRCVITGEGVEEEARDSDPMEALIGAIEKAV